MQKRGKDNSARILGRAGSGNKQPIILEQATPDPSLTKEGNRFRRRCIKSSLFVSVGLVRFSIVILALNALFAPIASAHDFSTSYSKIRVDGSHVQVQFTLNALDLHSGPKVDRDGNGLVTAEELDDSIENIFAALKANYHLEAPEPPERTIVERYEFISDNVVRLDLLYSFSHEVVDLKISASLYQITQANHQHLLQIGEGDDTRQGVLDANRPFVNIDVNGRTFFQTVWDFVKLGIEHIVTGYDHLAFLVGLLLMTSTLLQLVKVVTSFTIAHSVTLAVATFGLISLPSRLIESLIALSIAYIAIENFTGKTLVHRWKITFLFGLVHGFGFSNVLREMELTRKTLAISLFSFNAGVEIGQVIFVCVVFPLVVYATASRWKDQFLSATSLVIMALGFYWFVQRAFLT